MLTRLQLKNWRSLRDVTIDDLTPITVFVGVNSSGKSNILDALHFVRYAIEKGPLEAVLQWGGYERIRTVNANNDDLTEIGFSFLPKAGEDPITYNLKFRAERGVTAFWFREQITSGDAHWERVTSGTSSISPHGDVNVGLAVYLATDRSYANTPIVTELLQYVTKRWQLLREGFVPMTEVAFSNTDSFFVIEPTARNLPKLLSFIRRSSPEQFKELQEDLHYLLNHVRKLSIQEDDRETRVLLTESSNLDQEAFTVSAGTARILAMLAAIHINDWYLPNNPALVVVDEPDLAIHPLLLRNLLETIRMYANYEVRETGPRGFLLTTHNPLLLDYFRPEEVRIVERDEQGFTTVNRVDPATARYWLERDGAYNVGEMWRTGLIGGIPE